MKKLQIIGVGTRRFSQMTLEALEALKQSDCVCFIEVSKEQIRQYLDSDIKLVDLHNDYHSDRRDIENYKSMIKSIIKEVALHNTTSVVVAGHPRLGVFITSALEQWCQNKEIDFNCFEGISSFDVMSNMNQTDILENGTALVDINRALLFDYQLNTQVDHYFYHVCSVANPITAFDNAGSSNNLSLLVAYLKQNYPGNHDIYLLKASVSADLSQNQKVRLQINEIQAFAEFIDFSTTLFVPALPIKVMNQQVLATMQLAQQA